MRADTFIGQVIAVLSRRASAFALDSAEPQTFPGRLRALLSRRRRADIASFSPIDNGQLTEIGKSRAEAQKTPKPRVGRRAVPRGQQASKAGESVDLGAIHVLAHELRRRGPHVRLRVRAHPGFAELERSLDRGRHNLALILAFVGDLNRVRERAHDLARDRSRNRDLNPANDHDLARELDRDLARALAHDLARDLDLGHRLALDRAFDPDLDLDRDPDLANALDRAFDLADDFDRALASARDVAISDLDRAFANSGRLSASARASARSLARDLDRFLDRKPFFGWELANDLESALAVLDGSLHDFTKADLRDMDLTHVQLEGVRWSAATQWPTDWVAQVALDSVQVAPNVFEVRGGDAYVPTPL